MGPRSNGANLPHIPVDNSQALRAIIAEAPSELRDYLLTLLDG
jgi:hypothetical protein